MVVLHPPKDIGSRGATYAKCLLDFPLGYGRSFGPSEETEDLGLYPGDGILYLVAYSLFDLTGKEVGENLQGQGNMLGMMGHRFSLLLIVSLLTIIAKILLFD